MSTYRHTVLNPHFSTKILLGVPSKMSRIVFLNLDWVIYCFGSMTVIDYFKNESAELMLLHHLYLIRSRVKRFQLQCLLHSIGCGSLECNCEKKSEVQCGRLEVSPSFRPSMSWLSIFPFR